MVSEGIGDEREKTEKRMRERRRRIGEAIDGMDLFVERYVEREGFGFGFWRGKDCNVAASGTLIWTAMESSLIFE